jgi:hypothetical protein
VLRTVVLAAGAILTCLGIGLVACGVGAPGWQALIIGAIVLIGTLFERWRYRRIEARPKGHWQRTGEQFIDPSTGVQVEVLFNPDTGERRYVDAGSGEPSDGGRDP